MDGHNGMGGVHGLGRPWRDEDGGRLEQRENDGKEEKLQTGAEVGMRDEG